MGQSRPAERPTTAAAAATTTAAEATAAASATTAAAASAERPSRPSRGCRSLGSRCTKNECWSRRRRSGQRRQATATSGGQLCLQEAGSRCQASYFEERILNATVITPYNNKSYNVDDIDFSATPMSTFDKKGTQVRYVDYFREAANELQSWNMSFNPTLVTFQGRVLPEELIRVGNGRALNLDLKKGEFPISRANLFDPNKLNKWAIIYPGRIHRSEIEAFLQTLHGSCSSFGFQISQPLHEPLPNDNSSGYVQAIEQLYNKGATLVMCIVMNQREERYSAIKKKCYVNRSSEHSLHIISVVVPGVPCRPQGQSRPYLSRFLFFLSLEPVGGGARPGQLMESDAAVHSCIHSADPFFEFLELTYLNCCLIDDSSSLPSRAGEERQQKQPKRLQQNWHSALLQNRRLSLDGSNDACRLRRFPRQSQEKVVRCTRRQYKQHLVEILQRCRSPRCGIGAFGLRLGLFAKYDFFLVSQAVNQGTVSPTNYNVIYDALKLKPDQIQRITYKLCMMYYNWSNGLSNDRELLRENRHKSMDRRLEQVVSQLKGAPGLASSGPSVRCAGSFPTRVLPDQEGWGPYKILTGASLPTITQCTPIVTGPVPSLMENGQVVKRRNTGQASVSCESLDGMRNIISLVTLFFQPGKETEVPLADALRFQRILRCQILTSDGNTSWILCLTYPRLHPAEPNVLPRTRPVMSLFRHGVTSGAYCACAISETMNPTLSFGTFGSRSKTHFVQSDAFVLMKAGHHVPDIPGVVYGCRLEHWSVQVVLWLLTEGLGAGHAMDKTSMSAGDKTSTTGITDLEDNVADSSVSSYSTVVIHHNPGEGESNGDLDKQASRSESYFKLHNVHSNKSGGNASRPKEEKSYRRQVYSTSSPVSSLTPSSPRVPASTSSLVTHESKSNRDDAPARTKLRDVTNDYSSNYPKIKHFESDFKPIDLPTTEQPLRPQRLVNHRYNPHHYHSSEENDESSSGSREIYRKEPKYTIDHTSESYSSENYTPRYKKGYKDKSSSSFYRHEDFGKKPLHGGNYRHYSEAPEHKTTTDYSSIYRSSQQLNKPTPPPGMSEDLMETLLQQEPHTFSDGSKVKRYESKKKFKSDSRDNPTTFNVGYSIGFGSPLSDDVVVGKPKDSNVEVNGEKSIWKKLNSNVEMSHDLDKLRYRAPESTRTVPKINVLKNGGSSVFYMNNNSPDIDNVPTVGKSTFDHNNALRSTNLFDFTNAVQGPIALPLQSSFVPEAIPYSLKPKTSRQLDLMGLYQSMGYSAPIPVLIPGSKGEAQMVHAIVIPLQNIPNVDLGWGQLSGMYGNEQNFIGSAPQPVHFGGFPLGPTTPLQPINANSINQNYKQKPFFSGFSNQGFSNNNGNNNHGNNNHANNNHGNSHVSSHSSHVTHHPVSNPFPSIPEKVRSPKYRKAKDSFKSSSSASNPIVVQPLPQSVKNNLQKELNAILAQEMSKKNQRSTPLGLRPPPPQ
ncbi:unnamed protein product [Nesidiocoris tenuis]|uniref:Uncharacterized protein n=1 Tax=Nesidiocoris tenuis TaxID=355587 RepID=A0A6H5HDC7_9HEMI|nr:unnamed protein product [Nesidiocoris tenuis]